MRTKQVNKFNIIELRTNSDKKKIKSNHHLNISINYLLVISKQDFSDKKNQIISPFKHINQLSIGYFKTRLQ